MRGVEDSNTEELILKVRNDERRRSDTKEIILEERKETERYEGGGERSKRDHLGAQREGRGRWEEGGEEQRKGVMF